MLYLVDEQDARNELGNALVNVLVDDLVDLGAELVGDFRLARLHQLAHHAHDVLPALGPRVGHVQIVQRHVLDHLLLLVHVALGHRHVLLGLEIKLRGVRVRAAHALDGTRVGLDVDDVAQAHALLLDGFVDGRVQAQLLCALGRLQHHDEVRNRAAVATKRVLRLLGRELRHLALINLLRLADTQA